MEPAFICYLGEEKSDTGLKSKVDHHKGQVYNSKEMRTAYDLSDHWDSATSPEKLKNIFELLDKEVSLSH